MSDTSQAGTIKYGTRVLNFTTGQELDYQIDNGLIPNTSIAQQIIGHTTTRDSIILFSTDDLGMDCIWRIDNVLRAGYDIELLYVRNLGFSTSKPIQAIFNYENEDIQKIYWVDGEHQIRFLNITHNNIEGNESLIDVPSSSINFVGTINMSQPSISAVNSGGTHTAGMVQYAYNLYRLNGSQTKLSPLSELVPLDKGPNLGGGELNEIVGAVPTVQIDDIDTMYTHIKVYAIKYTSLDQIPSINLIEERELDDNNITVFDDGSTISSLSLDELLFLGSDPIIPKHIETKYSRLFPVNIQTKEFTLPEELDMRAYGFPQYSSTTKVYDNIYLNGNTPTGEGLNINSTSYSAPNKHDCINLNYDINKYLPNTTTFGVEGKYIKLEVVRKVFSDIDDLRVLKDREIYRFGIEFYNNLGQKSLPIWVADIKMPTGNLEGFMNTISATIKPEFYTAIENLGLTTDTTPVGYRILRANRTINDKTILCQGLLTSMMVNSPRESEGDILYKEAEKRANSDVAVKLPNILTRTFEEVTPLKPALHLGAMQNNDGRDKTKNFLTEIQYDDSERKADTYQYTTMYQLHSPELIFSNVNLNASTQFSIIGGAVNSYNSFWGQNINVTTKIAEYEGKALNGITPHAPGATDLPINGGIVSMLTRGLIFDSNGTDPDKLMTYSQWNREFHEYVQANSVKTYSIYGAPEFTERGQGITIYNNNSKYSYSNSLEGFLSDGEDRFDEDGTLDRTVISINSYGGKCVTFVADQGDNADIPSYNRIKMENLYNSSGINNTNTTLVAELVRPVNDIYFGSIYSGNSYEDKKRTDYIGIGTYNDILEPTQQIDNAGDTFVQKFKFTRMGKTDVEVYASGVNQITEIVSVYVETSIDLKNRNDISLSQWDSRFQPRYTEYHEYNDVYSQQSTLVKSLDVDYTFRSIKNFDTRIQATKLKVPNESIDSWTDILVNETMDLDGKFGAINGIMEYKDNLYTFQDTGIAKLSINPRIQVQGNDGVAIELGTGGILYDHNYVTTKTGSINKWGMVSGKKGIYYYDALNKGIGRIPDATAPLLTDLKGFHSYFNNNYDYQLLSQDNPVKGYGVTFGYDNYNNDVYFTFLQDDKSFTRCFNESVDQFVDLKQYLPSRYINKGERLLSVPSTRQKYAYEHNKGIYNNFYDKYYPSYIILMVNPESDMTAVYDSIYFNSELYLDDVDQPDKTITHIQAYNEYQDSGRIPLVVGRNKNLRRKFREWKAEIPRDGRNRIRNPWVFLKLELENKSNYKLVLHDIIVSYTV